MLVLSRKRNESIVLDTQPKPTRIVVVGIQGQAVRLGIDAPSEIAITRPDAIDQNPPEHRRDGEGAFQ